MNESTARTGWNDPQSARLYDQQMIKEVGGPIARGLLQAVPPGQGLILEVATGTGFFSEWLLQASGPETLVLGCDAGRAVLEVAAEKRLQRLRLVQADAHNLPVPSRRFAAAYCSLAMQIFLDPDAVVREMRRALREGGWLAYAIPARGTLAEFWSTFKDRAVRPDLRGLIGPEGLSKIDSWITPDDALESSLHQARLRSAGLQDARVRFHVEQLVFRDAQHLIDSGGFGHFNYAVETIPNEALRPGVLAEVASMLNRQRGSNGLRVTIRALVASARAQR